jgi:hypothetical protein
LVLATDIVQCVAWHLQLTCVCVRCTVEHWNTIIIADWWCLTIVARFPSCVSACFIESVLLPSNSRKCRRSPIFDSPKRAEARNRRYIYRPISLRLFLWCVCGGHLHRIGVGAMETERVKNKIKNAVARERERERNNSV